MKPILMALMAFAAAAGATASSAGEVSSIVDDVKTLCIANHSDPALVIKAAESAGWRRAPSSNATTSTMARTVDGAHHFIDLTTQDRDAGSIRIQRKNCAASVFPPLNGDLAKEVRDYLAHEPTSPTHNGATAWLYTEQDGRREFLKSPDDLVPTLASGRGPVLYLYVFVTPHGQGLTYAELTPD